VYSSNFEGFQRRIPKTQVAILYILFQSTVKYLIIYMFLLFLYRIFSHPNVLPVIGCCNSPPNLVVISQYMPWGSLYTLLHEGARVTVDTALALRLAVDVARAMSFLHSLERIIPQFYLNSHHIMVL